MTERFPQVRTLRSRDAFLERCAQLGIDLPLAERVEPGGVLASEYAIADGSAGMRRVGNRFAVLPMEGWDGTPDGRPTELVERRWRRFGASGAKLVWGGEAVAVRADGRANPNQLVIGPDLGHLREVLVDEHRLRFGPVDDLVIGLQLTHSGRFARAGTGTPPLAAYHHAVLDARVPDARIVTDEELDRLVDDFVAAARVAHDLGFDFVDVKACHGYLGHELLSARTRPGRYGGDLVGRSRFLRTVVAGIRRDLPDLAIGVRLSAFDLPSYAPGADGRGVPATTAAPYRDGFGLDGDLTEASALLALLAEQGQRFVCVTGGSPYYCPHAQRPAYFPPSDGYLPPEDPLVGVARLLGAARALKQAHPATTIVGTGFSYLQEWLPHVARETVAQGWMDAVGLGRMMLSYPELPADVLAGRPLDRQRLCRTFSDCTTAPRNGLVSGCYPLDDFYKARPERVRLAAAKRATAARLRAGRVDRAD